MVIQDNTIPRLSFADGCGICFAVCYKKEVAQRAADESRLFVFPCLIRHLVIIT